MPPVFWTVAMLAEALLAAYLGYLLAKSIGGPHTKGCIKWPFRVAGFLAVFVFVMLIALFVNAAFGIPINAFNTVRDLFR